MIARPVLLASLFLLALSGCGLLGAEKGTEPAVAVAPAGAGPTVPEVWPLRPEEVPPIRIAEPRYTVRAVRVTVPEDLRVSESRLYYPIADIVWRGDPPGDRHAQVQAIFARAAQAAAAGMTRGPEAALEIEVRRFHSLTEGARRQVGGVHSIRFDLTVRDPASGAVLEGPRRVVADFPAYGGAKAIEWQVRGVDEKARITGHIANVLRRELALTEEPAPDAAGAG